MKVFSTIALLTVVATTALAPIAHADSQSNKNNWRNGAIGGGAVALYGLTHHNNTATILGAAAGAYSASRYEKERKAQSNSRARYHRHHRRHHYHH